MGAIFGAFVAIFGVSIFYWIIQRIQQIRLRKKLGFDGPPFGIPQFFVGHIYDLFKHAITEGPAATPFFLNKWNKIYGSTYAMIFGTRMKVTTTDPEIIKEVFIKQFSNFVDRDVCDFCC
uniref:Cytochrome P450 n=1 Tax=Panagrolaimus superbus TaxID=310955 RepID=A0A914ZCM1_9BILA